MVFRYQYPETRCAQCFYALPLDRTEKYVQIDRYADIQFDSYCSWLLYLWIHFLAKIYLKPQNQYLRHFCSHLWTFAEGKEFELPMCMFLAEVGQHSAFLFQFSYCNKYSFHGLFSAIFFIYLCFCWWIPSLKCPPSVVWKCYLALLSARRPQCALWENMFIR